MLLDGSAVLRLTSDVATFKTIAKEKIMPIVRTVHLSFSRKLAGCLLVAVVLAGMLAGCSTPETRSKERSSAFEALNRDDQRLVLQGKIREGLGEDAVYVAMGHPSRRVKGQREGKQEISWIYSRLETRQVASYSPRVVVTRKGRYYVHDVYEPVYDSYLVDAFEVTFRNGKVVGWKEL